MDPKKKTQKIDEAVEESFPASDPPSYSTPGKNDQQVKPGQGGKTGSTVPGDKK